MSASPCRNEARGWRASAHTGSPRSSCTCAPRDGVRVASPATMWAQLAEVLTVDELIVAGDAIVHEPRLRGGIRDEPGSGLATVDQLRASIGGGAADRRCEAARGASAGHGRKRVAAGDGPETRAAARGSARSQARHRHPRRARRAHRVHRARLPPLEDPHRVRGGSSTASAEPNGTATSRSTPGASRWAGRSCGTPHGTFTPLRIRPSTASDVRFCAPAGDPAGPNTVLRDCSGRHPPPHPWIQPQLPTEPPLAALGGRHPTPQVTDVSDSAHRTEHHQHSMTLTARPPSLVSLYLCDMSMPVWRIVSTTASSET